MRVRGQNGLTQLETLLKSKRVFIFLFSLKSVDKDGALDKESTSYNDIFDAFRLALKFYSFRDSSEYD
jgi:hypothetical protein